MAGDQAVGSLVHGVTSIHSGAVVEGLDGLEEGRGRIPRVPKTQGRLDVEQGGGMGQGQGSKNRGNMGLVLIVFAAGSGTGQLPGQGAGQKRRSSSESSSSEELEASDTLEVVELSRRKGKEIQRGFFGGEGLSTNLRWRGEE